jgi:hypothetical protein
VLEGGALEGASDGTLDGTFNGAFDGTLIGTFEGTLSGTFGGTLDGAIEGSSPERHDLPRAGPIPARHRTPMRRSLRHPLPS